jgi:hypothetical protein
MRDSRYLWSAVINGSISVFILIGIVVVLFAPVQADVALSIVRGLIAAPLLCGSIAIIHYRAHLLGKQPRSFAHWFAR